MQKARAKEPNLASRKSWLAPYFYRQQTLGRLRATLGALPMPVILPVSKWTLVS
jgi:hypothetical protein